MKLPYRTPAVRSRKAPEMTTMLLHGQPVTRESMLRFKKAYLHAMQRKEEVFEFDGQQVLTSYAKYVVEYAETQLGTL